MNIDKFKAAYNESRNGANGFYNHALNKLFMYSDGVQECAEAGCYWFLDILATELPAAFKEHQGEYLCVVTLHVKDSKATIQGMFSDDDQAPYKRIIDYTDMPDGDWNFYVQYEPGNGLVMILPTEY